MKERVGGEIPFFIRALYILRHSFLWTDVTINLDYMRRRAGGGGVMLLSVYSRLAAWDDHKTDFTAPVRSIDARFVFCQLLPDF